MLDLPKGLLLECSIAANGSDLMGHQKLTPSLVMRQLEIA